MKSRTSFRFLLVSRVLLAGLALTAILEPASYAADRFDVQIFPVNTTNDTHDAKPGDGVCCDKIDPQDPQGKCIGDCSLRAAIEEINASPEAGVIYQAIDLNHNNYILTEGQLEITHSLALYGVPSGSTISAFDVDMDGKRIRKSRIFAISKPGTKPVDVTIGRVIITGGNGQPQAGQSSQPGGGIFIGEGCSVRLGYSVVRDNQSSQRGGGIYNEGRLSIDFSTVENNHNIGTVDGGGVQSTGGGIYNHGSGTAIIFYSTISGNGALRGGGINNHGQLWLYNCTISDNMAYGGGGGIRNGQFMSSSNAIANISFSTITNNTANALAPPELGRKNEINRTGGGIQNFETVKMDNTIVAGNKHCQTCDVFVPDPDYSPDCYSKPPAVFTSFRGNLVRLKCEDQPCPIEGREDIVNNNWNLQDFEVAGTPFDQVGKDPKLGSFEYHGGLLVLGGLGTKTYSLQPDSPAINKAICRDPNTFPFFYYDQRGALRPVSMGCDVGAFELGTARNFTTSVSFVFSAWGYNQAKKQSEQTVTLQNKSLIPIQGPVFLVLDGLARTLVNRDGFSVNVGQTRSDYVGIPIGGDRNLRLNPGKMSTPPVILTFDNPPTGNPPTVKNPRFTPRVLAGGEGVP